MDHRRISDYLYSVPERVLRSLSALAGGALHELSEVMLPARVRRSRLYQSLVENTVRFLVEQVGQVEAEYPKDEELPGDFLIRRTAGNVVELAGLVAFRASPVWVLAALADLAGAGRELIQEISGALQQEGLLDPATKFETVDQILDGLEHTSGRLAEAVNTPPLNVASLREEWRKLRTEAARFPRASFPSTERLWSQWTELKQEAAAQQRSVVELSSAIALAAVRKLPAAILIGGRRTGEVIGRGLLDHYRSALAEIRETGYVYYWVREFRPYFIGAARQFSPGRVSLTEKLLARRRG